MTSKINMEDMAELVAKVASLMREDEHNGIKNLHNGGRVNKYSTDKKEVAK